MKFFAKVILSKIIQSLFILALITVSAGCGDTEKKLSEKRIQTALSGNEEIELAAVGSWKEFDQEYGLWAGIKLAVDEINNDGGILGRQIKLFKKDDSRSVKKAQNLAREMAENPRITCAFVNAYSNVTQSVIPLYEYFGMLMVTPNSNSVSKDLPYFSEYRLIFQNCPNVTDEAAMLLSAVKSSNLKRVIIYNVQEFEYGRTLADTFEADAFSHGLTIVDHRSYSYLSDDSFFRRDLRHWQLLFKFDAIIIAGYSKEAARIIRQARLLGIKVPFFGGQGVCGKSMLSPEFSKYTEGTSVISCLDPNDPDPTVKSFINAFRKKYQCEPNGGAAQSYGSVKMFAAAVKKAKSLVPADIANAWRQIGELTGPPGPYSYAADPKKFSRNLIVKKIKAGCFVLTGENSKKQLDKLKK